MSKNRFISQVESNVSGKKTPGSQNCSPLNVFVVACDKWSQTKNIRKMIPTVHNCCMSFNNLLFPKHLTCGGASHLIILNCLGSTLVYLRKTWSLYGQRYLPKKFNWALPLEQQQIVPQRLRGLWGLKKPRKKHNGVHPKKAPRKKVPTSTNHPMFGLYTQTHFRS